MGVMPAGITSVPISTNADGSVIVGYGDNGGAIFNSAGPMHAFRWEAGNFTDLGILPGAPSGSQSWGRAVTEDGSVVLGEGTTPAGQEAFIWRQDFGMISLTTFLSWFNVDLTNSEAPQIAPEPLPIDRPALPPAEAAE